MSNEPAAHYDRVTAAWGLLLGEELHYGVFERDDEPLARATARLTDLMLAAAKIDPACEVLDVGCGTGAPACRIAGDTGARVIGITTSAEGVAAARARAIRRGLDQLTAFKLRDGVSNGFDDASFDRAWVLESSHLMRDRGRLVSECARVLRPGGRLVLCDIVLRRPLDGADAIRMREPLIVLRAAFGDARMESLAEYERLAARAGLELERASDLTDATRPTFAHWRANAARHHDRVIALLGAEGLARFVESCDILERFWDDGTLGYGLLAAAKT